MTPSRSVDKLRLGPGGRVSSLHHTAPAWAWTGLSKDLGFVRVQCWTVREGLPRANHTRKALFPLHLLRKITPWLLETLRPNLH